MLRTSEPIVHDYAVLEVDRTPLLPPALPLGDQSSVELGDEVLCAGFPLDFKNVIITRGVVSGLMTRPSHFNALFALRTIVTDATIQYGHSGGPMMHLPSGRVVGINTLGHEIKDVLASRLRQWARDARVQQIPGVPDLIEYVMKYTSAGFNHAVSLEYATADPAMETVR